MMMKRRALLGALAAAALLLAIGCDTAGLDENQPVVYSAGAYDDGSKYVPCFWTGTVRTDLAGNGTNNAYAQSIAIVSICQ